MSPSTLAGYRIYLGRHILPVLGTKRIDRLRPADIDRLYASLRGSLAPASVRKVHTILCSALGQAVNRLDLRHVRLHDLRHYVATRLLDAGVPVHSVSERLGHASATTTLTSPGALCTTRRTQNAHQGRVASRLRQNDPGYGCVQQQRR